MCTADLQGANDEPGQKDLTEFCVETPLTSPFDVTWNWDDTAFPGNNSGDACALFDSDGDGKANFALCVTIKGNPAVDVSVREYSCADDRPDRCTNSVQIGTFSSTCDASVASNANPFDNGSDTVAACTIVLADFNAGNAVLTDTCSYPSQQPNSDPSDCIITPTDRCAGVVCNDNNPCTTETCDDGNCIYTPGNAGTVCRSAAGVCDVAESCDGTSAACPADAKSSAVCRSSAGVCDLAESCDGSSNDCPADDKSSEVCRSAAGVCDLEESCDGSSDDCPADEKSSDVCRSAAGVCDLAESCDGSSDDCPDDAKSSAVCRLSAGVCDIAEFCDGSSDDCPPDTKSTALCRPAAGICDVAESCNGSGNDCPADAKSTAVCRTAAGVCDTAESCDGSGNDCPADAKSTAVCRSAAGVCDAAESCDGSGNDCPADTKSSAVCRSAAGVCDVAESCNGTSNDCPADAKSSAVCRSAAGVCDVAESCNGTSNDCPTDAKSTAVCRSSAGVCDVAESCDGSSNNCPSDAVQSSGTTCRTVTGDCDIAEKCTGTGVTCPPDTGNTQCNFRSGPQIAPTGTTCQQYRDSQSATFSTVLYMLTKGSPASQVINSVSPGVFLLYDGVSLATNGTITVTETDGPWTRAIVVNQLQVMLYNLSCTTLHVGTLTIGSDGSVTITNVPAGNYILSVKYDPNSLVGYHPPTASTTYNFTVQANGLASGSASVTVAKKK